ncbi:glutathione synthase [Streptomyces sp. NBC_00459]|uniref:glutathione synthase n=1 Tax=Streptomyces sp. NBC_00459 TaxID=2975749 RepID=UPI002E17C5D8
MLVFVMDPVEALAPEHDTSLALMNAAWQRGHQVWHCLPSGLSLRDGRVRARARAADFTSGLSLGAPESLSLHEADAVLVRTDPPFDAEYLATTLLLEHLRGDTLLVNDPRGLREANEKLYACRFPDLMPATLVTAEPALLLAFAGQQRHGAVLKPLFGHGGRGVLRLDPGDGNARAIAETMTERGRVVVMAQEFLPEVAEGDKRILLLDGYPLGAVLRRPPTNDFRANLALGGEARAAELDAYDLRIVERIAPALRTDGLYLTGIDVIGGRLSEVNVTSPTGLVQLRELARVRHDLAVIRWIETTIPVSRLAT